MLSVYGYKNYFFGKNIVTIVRRLSINQAAFIFEIYLDVIKLEV